jgi:hypothetical protein
MPVAVNGLAAHVDSSVQRTCLAIVLQAHETIIRTSFRRRYDMSGVKEALVAPRAPTGTLSSALRLNPKPVAAPKAAPAPARARDVVLRSQKDES